MQRIKALVRSSSDPIVRGLVAAGVSANALTITSLLLNCLAGVVVALGLLPFGGAMYLVFCSLDFLDGAVARLSGSSGPFGAFLDSVLDRVSEAAVLVGLVYYYASRQEPIWSVVAAAALVGSFMVSYARARAEGLRMDCEVGWLQRTERIVLTGAALVLSAVFEPALRVALVVLVIATVLTTIQRILHVARLVQARTVESG